MLWEIPWGAIETSDLRRNPQLISNKFDLPEMTSSVNKKIFNQIFSQGNDVVLRGIDILLGEVETLVSLRGKRSRLGLP